MDRITQNRIKLQIHRSTFPIPFHSSLLLRFNCLSSRLRNKLINNCALSLHGVINEIPHSWEINRAICKSCKTNLDGKITVVAHEKVTNYGQCSLALIAPMRSWLATRVPDYSRPLLLHLLFNFREFTF